MAEIPREQLDQVGWRSLPEWRKVEALEAENTALRERAEDAERKVERALDVPESAAYWKERAERAERALAALTEDTQQDDEGWS